MKHGKVILLLVAIILVAVLPGTARAADIEMDMQLNFDGRNLHHSSWNRLEVQVDNGGGEDFQGRLVVEIGGQYTQEVFVQAGKQATAVFFLPPTNAEGIWDDTGAIRVVLEDTRGRTVANKRKNVAKGSNIAYAAVLGGDATNFARVANVTSLQVKQIEPQHLDNPFFADSIRAIIVSNPGDINLDAEQQANLRLWLEKGGVLIVGGGSAWQQNAALVPTDLLPFQPHGITTVAAQELAGFDLPAMSQDEYTLAVGEERGEILAGTNATSLLVRKSVGRGAVLWTALDLEAAPLENQANNEAFWEKLFSLQPVLQSSGMQHPSFIHRLTGLNQIFHTISQDKLGTALSPLRILLLLLAYIVLAGPVNWLVLKKVDRREWAWLTIPVLALLFTSGTFAVGRIGRGGQEVLYYLNMVDVHSEDLAEVRSYSGVFVPRRGEISLTAPGVLAPTSGGIVSGGQQNQLTVPNPPLWSTQRFYMEDHQHLSGNFAVKIQPQSGGNTLQVEVTNNSGYDLFDTYLSMGKRWYRLEALAAGETKSSSLRAAQSGLDTHAVLRRYSTNPVWHDMTPLLPDAPLAFVGFGEDELVVVEGERKSVSLNIWSQVLEQDSVNYGRGRVDIAPGVLIPEVVGDVDEHWGEEYHFYNPGSFELVFSLPRDLDPSQGEYVLNLGEIRGKLGGTVEVYNYSQGEWQELGGLHLQETELVNPAELVRDGKLRVRVNHDGDVFIYQSLLHISVKGGWIGD